MKTDVVGVGIVIESDVTVGRVKDSPIIRIWLCSSGSSSRMVSSSITDVTFSIVSML